VSDDYDGPRGPYRHEKSLNSGELPVPFGLSARERHFAAGRPMLLDEYREKHGTAPVREEPPDEESIA
jgi:hypothetical protein